MRVLVHCERIPAEDGLVITARACDGGRAQLGAEELMRGDLAVIRAREPRLGHQVATSRDGRLGCGEERVGRRGIILVEPHERLHRVEVMHHAVGITAEDRSPGSQLVCDA